MKLCYFNDYRLGVIKGDNVVDVTDAVKDIPHLDSRDLIIGLIAKWDSYKAKVEKAAADGKGVPREGRAAASAGAEARQHRLHGRQLHGRRHPAGEARHQRLPQGGDGGDRRR